MTDCNNELIHRMVLEALPQGIYVVNRDGKIILWSAGAEQITGYLRQDVLGRSCKDDFLQYSDADTNALEGTLVPLLETMREGHGVTTQLSLHTKAGHSLPVRLHTSLLRDDHGTVLGAFEIFEPVAAPEKHDLRQSKLGAYGCLDPLTGVFNHSLIQAHLRESLSLHLVYPVPFCVMCFAVDDLPGLRKRYGQAGVDAALLAVAQTIENGLRVTDFLGRWMDNEFLAILTECNESDVIKVGERLGRMVRSNGVPWWGDKIHVTVSLGATAVLDNDTVGSIVSRAERALQDSTDAGGNRVALVSS